MRRSIRSPFPLQRIDVCPDHYDEAASSRTQFAASALWPTGPMSLFAQFVPTGQNAANNNYLFSTVDGSALNGVRWNYNIGLSITFAADSSGTAQAPARAAGALVVSTGVVFTLGASWDGGLSPSGIATYANAGGSTPILIDTGGGTQAGTGAVNYGTNQPVTIGGRQGGTTRIMVGDQHLFGWWNRVLTAQEFLTAQFEGILAVPHGLVLAMVNGRDVSPYRWQPTTRQGITIGTPRGFVAPFYPSDGEDVIGISAAAATSSARVGGMVIG